MKRLLPVYTPLIALLFLLLFAPTLFGQETPVLSSSTEVLTSDEILANETETPTVDESVQESEPAMIEAQPIEVQEQPMEENPEAMEEQPIEEVVPPPSTTEIESSPAFEGEESSEVTIKAITETATEEISPEMISEEAPMEEQPADSLGIAVEVMPATEDSVGTGTEATPEFSVPTAGDIIEAPEVVEIQPTPESVAVQDTNTVITRLGIETPTEEEETAAKRQDLISINLDGVPLQEVVRMFTRVSGANIVAGTELEGNVTVSLKDVEWEPALRVILDSVEMALIQKSPGIYSVIKKTDLAAEPVTMETFTLKFTTVSNIEPVITKMIVSSNSSVASFPAANTLVVQETADRLNRIRDVITQIDQPRHQVFIEAKFVELNDQAIKDLGVNWSVLESYSVRAGGMSAELTETRTWDDSRKDTMIQGDLRTTTDILTKDYSMDGEQLSGGNEVVDSISLSKQMGQDILSSFTKKTEDARTAVLSADDFALTLSALKQNAGVEVISNPRIVVASGEKAIISIGRKDPNYVTITEPGASAGTVTKTRELAEGEDAWVTTGVKVEVQPTVNTESNITCVIKPKLDRILPARAGQQEGDLNPISTREISSIFNLESGRTVAIGGLTTSEDTETIKKVPILGDIPIIGTYLFRHTHTEKLQDEVIIFVTLSVSKPSTFTETTGVPSTGQLIYRYLNKQNKAATQKGKVR